MGSIVALGSGAALQAMSILVAGLWRVASLDPAEPEGVARAWAVATGTVIMATPVGDEDGF